MNKILNWLKSVTVCAFGHNFIDPRRKVQTYYCVRCGNVNPHIMYPDIDDGFVLHGEMPSPRETID